MFGEKVEIYIYILIIKNSRIYILKFLLLIVFKHCLICIKQITVFVTFIH
mgnify:CR=1 FL=1